MSTIAAICTSFMDDHWPVCSRPRPLTPQTAMRSISLGPAFALGAVASAGRPEETPEAAAAAAIIERSRNSRRFRLLIVPPGSDRFGDHVRLAVHAREQAVGLLVARELLRLRIDRYGPPD